MISSYFFINTIIWLLIVSSPLLIALAYFIFIKIFERTNPEKFYYFDRWIYNAICHGKSGTLAVIVRWIWLLKELFYCISFIAILISIFFIAIQTSVEIDCYNGLKEAKQKIEAESYFTQQEINEYDKLNTAIWNKEGIIKLFALKKEYIEEINNLGKIDIKQVEVKRYLSIKKAADQIEAEKSILTRRD